MTSLVQHNTFKSNFTQPSFKSNFTQPSSDAFDSLQEAPPLFPSADIDIITAERRGSCVGDAIRKPFENLREMIYHSIFDACPREIPSVRLDVYTGSAFLSYRPGRSSAGINCFYFSQYLSSCYVDGWTSD